jgi:hypothetical protein
MKSNSSQISSSLSNDAFTLLVTLNWIQGLRLLQEREMLKQVQHDPVYLSSLSICVLIILKCGLPMTMLNQIFSQDNKGLQPLVFEATFASGGHVVIHFFGNSKYKTCDDVLKGKLSDLCMLPGKWQYKKRQCACFLGQLHHLLATGHVEKKEQQQIYQIIIFG